MVARSLYFYVCAVFLLSIFIGIVFTPSLYAAKNISAVNGVLDLREWDFKKDGVVKLTGEWEFYWNQFIQPDFMSKKELYGEPLFYKVPGSWTHLSSENPAVKATGYTTLFLKLLLPKQKTAYAINVDLLTTAYKMYVNERLVLQNGVPGITANKTIPKVVPKAKFLNLMSTEAVIAIHIANFDHRRAGVLGGISFGLRDHIQSKIRKDLAVNLLLVGAIAIIGLYHFAIFFLRRSEKTVLYFGLFCGAIALRRLTTGEVFLHDLFPDMPWHILIRLEYLSIFIAIPVFLMFVQKMFPKICSVKILRTYQFIFSILTLSILLTPPLLFSHTVKLFQPLVVIGGLYVSFVVLVAIKRSEPGAKSFSAGFVLIFFGAIMEILYTQEIVQVGYVLPFTLLGFIFIQAYVISKRFSKAFDTVETQAAELKTMNLAYKNEILERMKLQDNLLESNDILKRSRLGIIMGLAKLAEYRDEDTGMHLERMREYSRMLASELSKWPKYQEYVTENYISDIYNSAILHDIGKVGIPDRILLKPGKLTDEEFDFIKSHPLIGGDAIHAIEEKINVQSFLTLGRQIAYSHHERWNGTGYPHGLAGDLIPLSARIVSVADVYDALTSERPYKKAFSHEKAIEIITNDRGTHFDPDVVDAFMNIIDDFDKVRSKFAESY